MHFEGLEDFYVITFGSGGSTSCTDSLVCLIIQPGVFNMVHKVHPRITT